MPRGLNTLRNGYCKIQQPKAYKLSLQLEPLAELYQRSIQCWGCGVVEERGDLSWWRRGLHGLGRGLRLPPPPKPHFVMSLLAH